MILLFLSFNFSSQKAQKTKGAAEESPVKATKVPVKKKKKNFCPRMQPTLTRKALSAIASELGLAETELQRLLRTAA